MYSQGKEEQYILDFFKDRPGCTVLDIGANDGKTFSNSLALIENGWDAVLVEPSPSVFEKLKSLHENNLNVLCVNVAIGEECGKIILHESGHHLKDKSDNALLSSINESETHKWRRSGVEFNKVEVDVVDFKKFCEMIYDELFTFDFITIDAEGMDLKILKQIDLTYTSLLCIEWNSIQQNKIDIMKYCHQFGMDKIIYESGENLLICR